MATVTKTAEKIKVEKQGILEQLRKLNEEQAKLNEARAKITESARDELLAEGHKIVGELKSLGYDYIIGPAVHEPPKRIYTKKSAGEGRSAPRQKLDKECPICAFKTMPLHDKRAHRSQTTKSPFTAEELQERGLVRV